MRTYFKNNIRKKINNEYIEISSDIYCISNRVFNELGSGHCEEDYQKALAIELGLSNKYEYAREAQIETFYKEFPLGNYRLDFLVFPISQKILSIANGFVIEVKKGTDLNSFSQSSNAPRQQILSYLRDLKKNRNLSISSIRHAMIINFGKNIFIENSIANENERVSLELWEYNENHDEIRLIKEIKPNGK